MDTGLLIWLFGLTILIVVGVVWVLDLQNRLGRLQRRNEKLFSGEEGDANLAAALEALSTRLAETTSRTERLVARAEQIDAILAHTVQG
ncbi:MAG: hypothetical protein DRI48_09625, partial [Chloroflexi bacterium]